MTTMTIKKTTKDMIVEAIAERFIFMPHSEWFYPCTYGETGDSLVRVKVTDSRVITERRRHIDTQWMPVATLFHFEFDTSAFDLWAQSFKLSE